MTTPPSSAFTMTEALSAIRDKLHIDIESPGLKMPGGGESSGGYRDDPEVLDPNDPAVTFELSNRDAAYSDDPHGIDSEGQLNGSYSSYNRPNSRRLGSAAQDGTCMTFAKKSIWILLVLLGVIIFLLSPKSTKIQETPLSEVSQEVSQHEITDISQFDDSDEHQVVGENLDEGNAKANDGKIVDISEWCGECHWGQGTTCDGRVKWMMNKHATPMDEAKAVEIQAGHCGAAAREEYEKEKANAVPLYPCRESEDDEGGHGVDDFCGYCIWGNTAYDCFQRVQYLMGHYGDSEHDAKKNLVAGGQCIKPDEIKEQEAKLIEQGLQEWCGSCYWGPNHCDSKADWYSNGDPVKRVEEMKKMMDGGHCKKAPLCDEAKGAEEDKTIVKGNT